MSPNRPSLCTATRGAFLFAAALAAAPSGWSFVTLGNGRLVGSASLRADYDSNIYVSSRQVEDLIGTATGEVRWVKQAGIVTMEAATGLSAIGFVKESEQNGVEPFVEAKFGYNPSDKTMARALVSYRRVSMANETVNDRTKSNDFLFDAALDHLTTEKLGFRVTANYQHTTSLTTNYSDTESGEIGLHALHVYSPKLKLLAGVTAGIAESSGEFGRRAVDGSDVRYTVGAEGEFAPKVTGEVNVGYAQRDLDGQSGGASGMMFLMSRVSWQASAKTTLSLVGRSDFDVTTADQSVRSNGFSVEISQRFSEKVTFDGSLGIDSARYRSVGTPTPGALDPRDDEGVVARGRVTYVLRDDTSLEFSAGYRDNDSTQPLSRYDRVNVGAAVFFRF